LVEPDEIADAIRQLDVAVAAAFGVELDRYLLKLERSVILLELRQQVNTSPPASSQFRLVGEAAATQDAALASVLSTGRKEGSLFRFPVTEGLSSCLAFP